MSITSNNTTIVEQDGWTYVTLHSTCIVQFNDVKSLIRLNHGGYVTHTTVRRMNEVAEEYDLPYKVRRSGGIMYAKVFDRNREYAFSDDNQLVIRRSTVNTYFDKQVKFPEPTSILPIHDS